MTKTRMPNIVLCLCDQLRPFELGCYGGDWVRTPHIDALAASGVRFETAISNNPVCTPARSCILSGQYSRTCAGMLGNTHENPPEPGRARMTDPTLAEVLRGHGYRTALIGKWHVSVLPEVLGFDTAIYPMIAHRYYGQTCFDHTGRHFTVDGFLGDFEDGEAARFLSEQGDRPFFLFHNISLPHQPIGPRHLPERYRGAYRREHAKLRANVFRDGLPAHDDFWFKVYRGDDFYWDHLAGLPERPEDRLPAGFDLRDLHALYAAAVACVDDQVGALLQGLRRCGLERDTIVVFTSDHGDNLGSHGLFNKGTANEESIRVPLILSGPGIAREAVDTQRVAQLVDVMPTLLDLAGVAVPDTVQGRNLAEVARNPGTDLASGEAFIESCFPWLGLRTATHLYATGFDQNTRQLQESPVLFHDLTADPLELENLATDGRQAATAEVLRSRLSRWNAATTWLAAPPYAGHHGGARILRPRVTAAVY